MKENIFPVDKPNRFGQHSVQHITVLTVNPQNMWNIGENEESQQNTYGLVAKGVKITRERQKQDKRENGSNLCI